MSDDNIEDLILGMLGRVLDQVDDKELELNGNMGKDYGDMFVDQIDNMGLQQLGGGMGLGFCDMGQGQNGKIGHLSDMELVQKHIQDLVLVDDGSSDQPADDVAKSGYCIADSQIGILLDVDIVLLNDEQVKEQGDDMSLVNNKQELEQAGDNFCNLGYNMVLCCSEDHSHNDDSQAPLLGNQTWVCNLSQRLWEGCHPQSCPGHSPELLV